MVNASPPAALSAFHAALAAARRDPRWLQIGFLASFLVVGLAARDFPVWHAPLVFTVAIATQIAFTRLLRLPDAGLLSPIITSSGLTLLLRADALWVPPLAAFLAIASKFTLRIRGRHFFNPANFGICALMLLTPRAWCSPAQWGEGGLLLLWMIALGCTVAHRAFRSDVSLAFLGAWAFLRAARVLWLGQPGAVLAHQLESGGLILFTFFMISDPKTTPRARLSRVAFGAVVAALAFALQHVAYARNPLLWALLLCAPLTPLADLLTHRTDRKENPCVPASCSAPLSAR
jgi:Na+-transporting NADH:ubiquinone oxidoreductase subunit NqrB